MTPALLHNSCAFKVLLLGLLVSPAVSFAPAGAQTQVRTPAGTRIRTRPLTRAPPAIASAKIIPVAYVGLGGALLAKATGTDGAARAVLTSAGLLSALNLASTDNQRYAGAKRAMARLAGVPKGQQGLAKKWYDIVRLHLLGQVVSLTYMVRASAAVGVLLGGASFMAANLLFFLLGAVDAKHDFDGLHTPIKPSLAKFVLTTDAILLGAALLGSFCSTGSAGRAIGSYIFSAGCMIGAVEGAPKTASALKRLLKERR